MSDHLLGEVAALARKIGHVFIATASPDGHPHVAAAESVRVLTDKRLAVSGWFCPVTESNLDHNPHVALVVWDRTFDTGFQVIGERQREHDIAMLDGYAPGLEETESYPQVERELILRVVSVLEFHHAQHTDQEVVIS